MQEEFDLVPNQSRSNLFKVTFDFYTPRAHFVILPRDGQHLESNDLSGLSSQSRRELLRVASSLVAEYHLNLFAVLSVHRGSWVSTKDKFHAHVCTDVDHYLDVFNRKENQIPGWPSSAFVTKQWSVSQDPRKYAENVVAYPVSSYYKKELGDISKIRAEGPADTPAEQAYKGYVLFYHPSEPKVGFAAQKKTDVSIDDLMQVLNAMNEFAGSKNLTDVKSKDQHQGCHLCIVFNFIDHGK